MIAFGTGGWRAEIGQEFTRDNVRLVGQALANLIHKECKAELPVIIGYDRRFLSLEAGQWLSEMLCDAGITVWFMKRSVPTPLVMHTVKKKGLAYGLEVTASHNPHTYNGIKVIVSEGRDANLDCTAALEGEIALLSAEQLHWTPFHQGVAEGKIIYLDNPFEEYLDDVLEQLDNQSIRKGGMRILFDTMHGSSTYPLMTLLYTNRCTVDLLNSNRDVLFGGRMPAPTQDTLVELQRCVVEGGYDLGIGIDGDGDRLGIIDSNGSYIDANSILCLLYYYLHVYKGWRGPVVRNYSTTHMLDTVAQSLGETCYEVPVGFKYISSKIDEVDAILGGESSGGLTVRGHIHGKDSIHASMLFVEMLCVTGLSASELLKELTDRFGTYIMEADNLQFAPEQKTAILKTVMEDKIIPNFAQEVVKVNYEDGCKVYFADNSFVSCRFSGTEPLLRIFAEASSTELAREYIKQWRKMLNI